MPVISAEAAPAQRKRSIRSLWLLLLPPLILLLVLGTATVHPLELGPIVMFSETLPGKRNGCRISAGPFFMPANSPILFHNQFYEYRGDGACLWIELHYWRHSVGWFRGRRIRE